MPIAGGGGPSYASRIITGATPLCASAPSGTKGGGQNPSFNIAAAGADVGAWKPGTPVVPLVLWFEASTASCFTDTAGTVPVTADGDLVAAIRAADGTLIAPQPTSANRPVYRTGGGKPYIESPDGARHLQATAAIQLANGNGEHSAIAACYFANNTGTQNVIDADGSGVRLSQLLRNNAGTLESIAFNAASTPFTDTSGALSATTATVISEITGTSTVEAFVNGTGNGSTATSGAMQAASAAAFTVFNYTGLTQPMTGRIYGFAVWAGVLSPADHAAAVSYFQALYSAAGGYTLTAATGAFTLSGAAMNPNVGMPAATGAFVLSGQAMTPKVTMPGATGAFAITGAAMTPKVGMPAATGVFTLSGGAANFPVQRRLTATTGAFTVNGQAAGLYRGLRLTAATGAFTLSGQASALLRGLRLAGATGAFVLNGGAAGLFKGFTLAGAAGAFTLNGSATNLLRSRNMPGATGAFTVTGQASALYHGNTMAAATGAFALSGSATSFHWSHVLTASPGAFVLSGQAALLAAARRMTATPGAYVLTPRAVSFHIAALPFFPDNAPALSELSNPLVPTTASVTVAGVPSVEALAMPAAVSAPQAFSKAPAPLPVNLEG